MGERKMEKASVLAAGAVMLLLSLCKGIDWYSVGIYKGCPLSGHILYPFFHANLVHAALNLWCLLCVVFVYDVSFPRLLAGYVVAALAPVGVIGITTPTVGLSGVVYFLLGSISFEVLRRWYYQGWMAFFLLIGFFAPNTNAWIHLYCYACGVLWALLNKPFLRQW